MKTELNIERDQNEPSKEPTPEYQGGNFYVTAIRNSIATKNKEILKSVLINMKDLIENVGTVKCTDISDKEIEQLINTGQTTIYVATGTLGERIIFSRGKMGMSVDKYGKEYRDVFRYILNLPRVEEETENPAVDIF